MVTEAEHHREVDAERRELIELRNTSEGLILTTERSLHEYSDLLTLAVEDIRADIQTLKDVSDTVDPDELKLAIQNLEQSAYRIADAMYEDATGTPGSEANVPDETQATSWANHERR